MRLTNYICFATKEVIPTAYETPFRFIHANRDSMKEVRTSYKKQSRRLLRLATSHEMTTEGEKRDLSRSTQR